MDAFEFVNGTTAIDYVRLLIADTDPANQLLDDQSLAVLINHAGSALAGAADALDAIATSEVLLSKKISTQDLTTDGPAVAAELRKQATALRARAATDVSKVTEEAFAFTPFHPRDAARVAEAAEWARGWWQ